MYVMTKSNTFCLFLFSFLLLSCSNGDKGIEGIVVPNNVSEDFRHIVRNIEIIPLEENGDHLLGSLIDILKCEDSYIVLDKKNSKIYRYSAKGCYINSIGNRGNGPEEYLDITNIQVYDGSIIVFSYPSKILYYSLDGSFVKSESVERLGFNSYIYNDELLSYYGYGGEDQYRLYNFKGINTSKVENRFLHFNKSVIDLSLGNNIFSKCDDGMVSVLDSYSNVVSVFNGEELYPYLTFDFGNYSIDDKFFEAKDPFEGGEKYIINGSFAIINKFIASKSVGLVQIERKKRTDAMIHAIYGLKRDTWEWYVFPEGKGDDGPYEPFQFIDGNEIYGVMDPDHMALFLKSYMPLINNWDSIAEQITGDNHIIFKLLLK